MKLTIKDRIVLPEILPQQGNMIEMLVADSITKKTRFTAREVTDFKLCQKGETLTWDENVDTDVEIDFEQSEVNLLKEQLRKLDEEKRISNRIFGLCVKIRDL